jgi:hypothetical protein
MKSCLKISILFLLANAFVWASNNYISVVVTDSDMMFYLQQKSSNISKFENSNVLISFVEDRKIVRYFQLGNLGDSLVTSDKNLCTSLFEKGLAGDVYSVFARSNVYCTHPLSERENILMILPVTYTRHTEENLHKIASNINSSIYFFEKDENFYEKIMAKLQNNVNVCGFLPLFQSIAFDQKTLHNTQEGITYYICPTIGLNNNAYNILIKSKNETKND